MHLSSLRNNLRIEAGGITPERFGERRVEMCSGATSSQKQKIQLNRGGSSCAAFTKVFAFAAGIVMWASFGLVQQAMTSGPYKTSKTAKIGGARGFARGMRLSPSSLNSLEESCAKTATRRNSRF